MPLSGDVPEEPRRKTEEPAAAFDDPRAVLPPDHDGFADRQSAERQDVARCEGARARGVPGADLITPSG